MEKKKRATKKTHVLSERCLCNIRTFWQKERTTGGRKQRQKSAILQAPEQSEKHSSVPVFHNKNNSVSHGIWRRRPARDRTQVTAWRCQLVPGALHRQAADGNLSIQRLGAASFRDFFISWPIIKFSSSHAKYNMNGQKYHPKVYRIVKDSIKYFVLKLLAALAYL